jgi:hypothetical protein
LLRVLFLWQRPLSADTVARQTGRVLRQILILIHNPSRNRRSQLLPLPLSTGKYGSDSSCNLASKS